jgi:hypothetical protein
VCNVIRLHSLQVRRSTAVPLCKSPLLPTLACWLMCKLTLPWWQPHRMLTTSSDKLQTRPCFTAALDVICGKLNGASR